MTARAPLWLARPSLVAALPRGRARLLLAALAAGTVAALLLAAAPADPLATSQTALVQALRHGQSYYTALADLARADPGDGVAVALPTLPTLAALLPEQALLVPLALLVAALLWLAPARLRTLMANNWGRAAGFALLVVGAIAAALLATRAPSLGWAALLIAIALLLHRPGERWVEPAALGACAALIDPAAAPALAVMALFAIVERRRREAAGWGAALLLALVALAFHRHALAAVLPAAGGTGDAYGRLATLAASAFPMLPALMTAPLALLALAGWLALADPLGRRIAMIAAAGLAFEGVGGAHPAAVVVPLAAIGLAFVPDLLHDLWRGALARRRITVTRILR